MELLTPLLILLYIIFIAIVLIISVYICSQVKNTVIFVILFLIFMWLDLSLILWSIEKLFMVLRIVKEMVR